MGYQWINKRKRLTIDHILNKASPFVMLYVTIRKIVIKMFLLIFQDEFSHLVQEWNTQRMNALSRAFNQMLYPLFEKELKLKLLEEAKNFVVKVSLSLFGADNERSGVLTIYTNHEGGNLVYRHKTMVYNLMWWENDLRQSISKLAEQTEMSREIALSQITVHTF